MRNKVKKSVLPHKLEFIAQKGISTKSDCAQDFRL